MLLRDLDPPAWCTRGHPRPSGRPVQDRLVNGLLRPVRWRAQIVQPEGHLLVAGIRTRMPDGRGARRCAARQSGEPGLRTGQRQRTRCQPFQVASAPVTGDQVGHQRGPVLTWRVDNRFDQM